MAHVRSHIQQTGSLEKGSPSMQEGTIFMVLRHPNEGWVNDTNRYAFPELDQAGIRFRARKVQPGRLLVTIDGMAESSIVADVAMPRDARAKVILTIVWDSSGLQIILNDDEDNRWIGTLPRYDSPRPEVAGGPVRPEGVYLSKIDEMQIRAGLGTHFDLLAAGTILRHLLADGDRLVDMIRKRLAESGQHIDLSFEVVGRDEPTPDDLAGIEPLSMWTAIDPVMLAPGDKLRANVDLKRFLKMHCLRYSGKNYTVLDIINSCANCRGGVHFGKPDSGQQALIDLDEIARIEGVEMSISCIASVVAVATRGLEPLTAAVRQRIASK